MLLGGSKWWRQVRLIDIEVELGFVLLFNLISLTLGCLVPSGECMGL